MTPGYSPADRLAEWLRGTVLRKAEIKHHTYGFAVELFDGYHGNGRVVDGDLLVAVNEALARYQPSKPLQRELERSQGLLLQARMDVDRYAANVTHCEEALRRLAMTTLEGKRT